MLNRRVPTSDEIDLSLDNDDTSLAMLSLLPL